MVRADTALRRFIVVAGGLFLCLTVFLGITAFAEIPDELEIDFFDVGQGDATLIQTPTHHTILIDGGRDATVSRKIAAELPFYDKTIDLVILTHPDLDHMGGLPDVLRRYRVGTIFSLDVSKDLGAYRAMMDRAHADGIPVVSVYAGDTIRFVPGLEMVVLAPEKGQIREEDLNNSSIVVKLTYNTKHWLFTGDAAEESENRMRARAQPLSADVLKIGHHGSRFSSSAAFLQAVGADVAVISTGAKNPYGHPHPEALERVARQGMTVYRTDRQGDIEMRSDGTFMTITTEKPERPASPF
ncbi:MBL fold metallo-hydrolase [Candidatus Uhrbacteria bacterium]|nr:MBL fold metallo-hydrolase [Candidatus Uhrbacteria bacterium]